MIDGMKERLTGIITDIHVFWAFPSFGLDAPENFANYNIFSLAKYEEYDGFLFAINVYQGYDMIKTYHPSLLSCGKPMVSLEYEMEGVPTIVPDGYSAEYRLVEHLIKEHGCRKINYVGGSADHPDNVLRKKAYTDALKANGIEIEDYRIRDYSFIDDDKHMQYFIKYYIGVDFQFADGREEYYAGLPEAEQLPIFPDPGCIGRINGKLVVKMGTIE